MFKSEIVIEDKDLVKVLESEKNQVMNRSSLKIMKNKIVIEAKDIIAFKSTVNGVIKLIEAYENTSKTIK